jgi:hypothetical protein
MPTARMTSKLYDAWRDGHFLLLQVVLDPDHTHLAFLGLGG